VQALAEHIHTKFSLATEYFDIPNPV